MEGNTNLIILDFSSLKGFKINNNAQKFLKLKKWS